jgi:hypothetical protein
VTKDIAGAAQYRVQRKGRKDIAFVQAPMPRATRPMQADPAPQCPPWLSGRRARSGRDAIGERAPDFGPEGMGACSGSVLGERVQPARQRPRCELREFAHDERIDSSLQTPECARRVGPHARSGRFTFRSGTRTRSGQVASLRACQAGGERSTPNVS